MREPSAVQDAADTESLPLDFVTMAGTARHALDFGAAVLDEDLETATLRLRGHLALLIPEAQDRLGRLAGAGVEEARQRMDATPSVLGPVRYAHALARSVLTLCAHLGHQSLPPLEGLTERQRRGADCVHCGLPLSRLDVKNLGEQITDGIHWFPRAHPRCLGGGAL